VEEFDNSTDSKFIKEAMVPYFKDLFKDLSMRCHISTSSKLVVDKIVFMEYTQLPGIINDRLFKMFEGKDDQLINESSFIANFIKIYISDVDTKMRMTFNM
jgi:hypothetical protein